MSTTLSDGRAPDPVVAPPQGGGLRRLLLGPPLPNDRERAERLSNPIALAILSSDALSSVAYATEEMLKVLIPVVGLTAFRASVPIAGAIVCLLLLLVLSYRQTIKAYPNAGGAYVVTRDNFGVVPAQAAGVALLIDYVMTVAVSVSAAAAALYSYFPALFSIRLLLAVAFVWLLAWANLRGVRAAGRIFAAPTYFFLGMVGSLLVAGAVTAVTGDLHQLPPPPDIRQTAAAASLLVLLRAYASGTTALTGVEAISNGVSVFRPVEWRNARKVLTWMGVILALTFGGITLLAWRVHPVPSERRTLVSELGRAVFGGSVVGRVALLLLQTATTAILVLAANTSFADFPRLASFHAGDGYLPRPLRRRGYRLVFSVGIVTLAVFATAVVLVLGADVHGLIPLYAVGVFVSFTFSQTGMVRRHLRVRDEGWMWGLVINALGAFGSALASIAILITKFVHGAWVVTILVPAGVGLFLGVHRHYQRVDAWLNDPATGRATWRRVRIVIALPWADSELERAALSYAGRMEPASIETRIVASWGTVRAVTSDLCRSGADDVFTLLLVPGLTGQASPPAWSPLGHLTRRVRRDGHAGVATLVVQGEGAAGQVQRNVCLLVVDGADGRARRALDLASLLRPDELRAVLVDLDDEVTRRAVEQWPPAGVDVPVQVLPAPYRERGGPLLAEVQRLHDQGVELVSVVVCTLGPRWWQRPLYLADTAKIRAALARSASTAVVDHRMSLMSPHTPGIGTGAAAVAGKRR